MIGNVVSSHAGALVRKLIVSSHREGTATHEDRSFLHAHALNLSPLRHGYALPVGNEWTFDEDGVTLKANRIVDGELEVEVTVR